MKKSLQQRLGPGVMRYIDIILFQVGWMWKSFFFLFFHTQIHKKKKKKKKRNLTGEKLQLFKTHFSQPNFLYIFVRKSKPLCGAGPNPFSGT